MWNYKRLKTPETATTSTAGFTLVELLVVIIMVGILAAIAAPGWLAYANRQRMNRARSDLLQILQEAQVEAQQKKANRVIKIGALTGAAPQVEVSSSAGTTGIVQAIGGEQNSKIQLAATSTALTFDYKGNVNISPFVFSVTSTDSNAASARCVIVTTLLGNMVQAEGNGCNPANYN